MSYDAIATAVTAAARQREPVCGAGRVIAIDGPSGAGKTDLAACWHGSPDTAVLHLEDLYPGWLGLDATPPVVAEMLAAVATGRDASADGWDWEQHRPGGTVRLVPRPLIVVEGVGAAAAVIRPFLSLVVWVDAPADVRHARAMARDGDTFAPWWHTWAEQERRHFARELTRTHADILVTT
ncbi:MAG: 4-amino-4-deoxy-L-arabinose transferase [Aeromicrobium sp.]|uniref:4-amino-4-deoxy-L-arabinose transferase n=1 Tax=Aeromicrobium sp. TaxID=1871063 RepID=UPI003C5B3D50